MSGCYIYVWLFLFAVFAENSLDVKVNTGLNKRVELKGRSLQQESVVSVEWTKVKGKQLCIIFVNNTSKCYSECCTNAHYYFNNNTLVLENVTAQDEIIKETIVPRNGTKIFQTFTLIIQYPPNTTGIVVSWTSSTSVTLKCEVSGSFQHLMWKRERVPILEKNRHSFSERNQTLHISNITSSDYGTYSCIASNANGESEQHINITDESGKTQFGQILLGFTLMGVFGLPIMFYSLYKKHHRQRTENGRTTDEGDGDDVIVIYQLNKGLNGNTEVVGKINRHQEVPEPQQVTYLPYVYTDFIKPKDPSQASAAALHFEDFGYSEETVVLFCECDEEHVLMLERNDDLNKRDYKTCWS